MPNRQTQNQPDKGRQNPGAFQPDDDEALESDRTTAANQDQGQQGRDPREADSVTDIEDEEAEDDEDEADGLGARP
jgi:hypothetical protein